MTGMRRSELLGLRWSDLDLEHAKAKIERALILVDYVPTISEPKTERGRRTVALDPATVVALREQVERQNFEAAMAGEAWENADGYVFTDELGRVIHPQSFTDRFKRYAKAAKLPVIRLHELRHSHATIALEAGVAPNVVSDRLGTRARASRWTSTQTLCPPSRRRPPRWSPRSCSETTVCNRPDRGPPTLSS